MSQLHDTINSLAKARDVRVNAIEALEGFMGTEWQTLADANRSQAASLADATADYSSLDYEARRTLKDTASALSELAECCQACHVLAQSYREQPEPEPAEEPTDALISAPTEPPPTNPTPEPEETNDDQF